MHHTTDLPVSALQVSRAGVCPGLGPGEKLCRSLYVLHSMLSVVRIGQGRGFEEGKEGSSMVVTIKSPCYYYCVKTTS